jgi:hypothetical protein
VIQMIFFRLTVSFPLTLILSPKGRGKMDDGTLILSSKARGEMNGDTVKR